MRFITAVLAGFSLAVFAGTAFAADHAGLVELSPLDRPLPGIRGPFDMRDPLTDSASGGASLPELSGSTDAPKMFGGMQARALPGGRVPLVGERYLERRQYPGPRPYWENDPLFTAPPP